MEKILVRKIKLGDEAGLKRNVFPTDDEATIKKSVASNVKDMSKTKDWIYLVAEINGEVVGTTYIKLIHGSYVARHIAELYTVVVSEKHRQRGVCRALVEEAKKIAKSRGIEMITLGARQGTIADSVYQKLGFITYGNLPNGIKDAKEYFNEKLYYINL